MGLKTEDIIPILNKYAASHGYNIPESNKKVWRLVKRAKFSNISNWYFSGKFESNDWCYIDTFSDAPVTDNCFPDIFQPDGSTGCRS